jgi:hypothetical protein
MTKIKMWAVLAVLVTPIVSQAELVIDTGPGDSVFGGIIVDQNQQVAGLITLQEDATISSVEGWLVSFYAVDYTIAIHSDTGSGPGPVIFSDTFVGTELGAGGGLPTWQGIFEQDWPLPAGNYWVSFSTNDFWGGALPNGALMPLAEYAADTFGGGWTIIPSTSTPAYGLRVGALDTSAEALLAEVASLVDGAGPGKSLSNKIMLAQTYLAVPDVESACLIMTGFINQVRAQRGKKLTVDVADELTADAETIQVAIGCN